MTNNPNLLRDSQVDCASTQIVGRDLLRPECISATPWGADAPSEVGRIDADSTQTPIAQQNGSTAGRTVPTSTDVQQLVLREKVPNGLALVRDGNIVSVTFGADAIGLMTRTLPSELDHWDCDQPVWTTFRQRQHDLG